MDNLLISISDACCSHENVVYIDTRSSEAFQAGHIPGAVNIPEIYTFTTLSTPEGLQDLVSRFREIFSHCGLSGAERAILYEDALDSGHGRSCRGYWLLSYLGYTRAAVLDGGFTAWKRQGLPIETLIVPRKWRDFPVNIRADIIVTAEDVLAALSDPGIIKLDVRDEDEWVGLKSSPLDDKTLAVGRLPEALWLPWKIFLQQGGQWPVFKTPTEIDKICAAAGIGKESPIYIYCFKGSRAACVYMALKYAGYQRVYNYFSSWNEWGRLPAFPADNRLLSRCVDTLTPT